MDRDRDVSRIIRGYTLVYSRPTCPSDMTTALHEVFTNMQKIFASGASLAAAP